MSGERRYGAEHDDFHPLDWQRELDVASDFVDRTVERVLADRRRIDAEAARVDEIELPAALLAAYRVPEISSAFVDRAAARVAEAREDAFRSVLGAYTAPQPTDDFVERTLSALRIDRSSLRLVREPEPPRPVLPFRRSVAVAAVLLGAALLVFAFAQSREEPAPPELAAVIADRDFSPMPWSTAFARLGTRSNGGLDFQPVAAPAAGGDR